MFKKLKEKKGFTLVELIVVLVILAILAALLIPALTKYIDKAKEKDIIAETRQVVMAAQTEVDEAYAKVDVGTQITINATMKTEIANLAEVNAKNIETITLTNDNKVDSLTYTKKGKTCTYKADGSGTDGKYTVAK